jgi:hypothetical protein
MAMGRPGAVALLSLSLVACAGRGRGPDASVPSGGGEVDSEGPSEADVGGPGQPGRDAPSQAGPSSTQKGVEPLAWRAAPVDGREPNPQAALPEVTVRHIGLHIGGGPNDEPTRRPVLRAIEKNQQRFLWCYRQVERPLLGGVFGVDLYVGSRGGAPEVRSTRQKLGSDGFEGCMVAAFREVSFPKPPRPTVLSYSLRFDVSDSTQK